MVGTDYGRRLEIAAVAMVMLCGCSSVADNIGDSATGLGQSAADQSRRSAIDRLEEAGDCRNLLARLNDYESGGNDDAAEYAREASGRLGCDDS